MSCSHSTIDVPDWEWDTSSPFSPAHYSPSQSVLLPPVAVGSPSKPIAVSVGDPTTPSICPASPVPPAVDPCRAVSVGATAASAVPSHSDLRDAAETVALLDEAYRVAIRSGASNDELIELLSFTLLYPVTEPPKPVAVLPAVLRRAVPDERPPSVFCQVHVGSPVLQRCLECVAGIYVCPLHLLACGGEGWCDCAFCGRLLCWKHSDCPCDLAVARRVFEEEKARSRPACVSVAVPACAVSAPVAEDSCDRVCGPNSVSFFRT